MCASVRALFLCLCDLLAHEVGPCDEVLRGRDNNLSTGDQYFIIYKLVNKRRDTDLGNTQGAPRGGESDCVLDRHGRRGWSQGGRMHGRDAHAYYQLTCLLMR